MVIDRTTKLRFRRRLKRSQKQIEVIGSSTEENLERHFFRRLGRLYGVRRFLLAWMLLVILLIGGVVVQARALSKYYQEIGPTPGGIYTEGIIGSFTDANPLYATNEVDASVARLLFSSLLTYDQNDKLVNDLATGWQVDTSGKVYTVNLRNDVRWHDGQIFTSADVVFTYKTIQNPNSRSPLYANWKGVTVTALNDFTVTFTLPNVLASFPYSLTNGLIPKHILKDVPASALRSDPFNTVKPIGTGPFKWETIEVLGGTLNDREQRIGLLPFNDYYGGQPKLNRFIIRTFLDDKTMVDSFRRNELTAIAGSDDLPPDVANARNVNVYNVPLTSAVMIFLRTSAENLKDVKVRQALTQSTNVPAIIKTLQYPTLPANGPLLKGQIGYDAARGQLPYDPKTAAALFDQAGWVRGPDGIRSKNGQPLKLTIFALSNPEFATVIAELQKQWHEAGVQLESNQMSDLDLQPRIDNPQYDTLLYGISIGNDPDVFPYWHSQANALLQKRLNFSDYDSKTADSGLEGGRTRLDPELRAIKYRPFLEAWRGDAPAIALYQPRFLYVAHGRVYNFEPRLVNAAVDRFSNVQNWMIRTERTIQD